MASRDACRYNTPEVGAANCGAGVLAGFVHDLVEPLLGSLLGDDRTARQLEIVNSLVAHLMSTVANSPVLDDDALAPPARQLLSLVDPTLHGVGEATAPQRPPAPLNLPIPATHTAPPTKRPQTPTTMR